MWRSTTVQSKGDSCYGITFSLPFYSLIMFSPTVNSQHGRQSSLLNDDTSLDCLVWSATVHICCFTEPTVRFRRIGIRCVNSFQFLRCLVCRITWNSVCLSDAYVNQYPHTHLSYALFVVTVTLNWRHDYFKMAVCTLWKSYPTHSTSHAARTHLDRVHIFRQHQMSNIWSVCMNVCMQDCPRNLYKHSLIKSLVFTSGNSPRV